MSEELNHVMVDVETLSTKANAVIVTIAAVKFSFQTDTTTSFCVNISPKSSKELGLHIDPLTVQWWKDQKPEAAKSWMHSQVNLPEAIEKYEEFLGPQAKNLHYWFHGLDFDRPIIQSSFEAINKTPAWKYWNCHDSRTVMYLADINLSKQERIGNYHNAIDDCLTQIHYLKKALAK